jgi:hypothetical protein
MYKTFFLVAALLRQSCDVDFSQSYPCFRQNSQTFRVISLSISCSTPVKTKRR